MRFVVLLLACLLTASPALAGTFLKQGPVKHTAAGGGSVSKIGTKITDAWSGTPTSSPTLTNYTTTTGTGKCIAAKIAFYTESGASVSAYTIDGASASRISSSNIVSGGLGTEIWVVALGSHTGGSKAQSVTFSANTESGFITLVEFNGCNQTTPGARGVTASGGIGTSPSIALTAVASGEYSIDVVSGFSGGGNATPGGTATHVEIRDEIGGGGTLTYAGENSTATGTVTMSWANDTGSWAQSAAVIAP